LPTLFAGTLVSQRSNQSFVKKKLRYLIGGIVDLNSIPKENRHLEMGIDEKPIPLVHFLPDLNTTTIVTDKKVGRKEPCPCGSGMKYKKCCG
jgi:preprotein translocase subunit SecA